MPFEPLLGTDLPVSTQVKPVKVGDKPLVNTVQHKQMAVDRRDEGRPLSCQVAWHLALQDQVTDGEHQAVIVVVRAARVKLAADELRCELDKVNPIQVAQQTPEL